MASSLAASVAGPVAGAVVGGMMSKKGQKQSQTTMPVLPEKLQGGYDLLLDSAMDQAKVPFQPTATQRIGAPTNAYEALFDQPEMRAIQAQQDDLYYKSRQPQAPAPAPAPAPQQPANNGNGGFASLLNLGGAQAAGQYGGSAQTGWQSDLSAKLRGRNWQSDPQIMGLLNEIQNSGDPNLATARSINPRSPAFTPYSKLMQMLG